MEDFRPVQNVDRVFKRMLNKPYYGKVGFNHLFKMSPEDFHEATQGIDIHKFIDAHSDRFGKYLQDNGRVSMLTIRIKGADICSKYVNNSCDGLNCAKLHLCKDYVSQICKILECNLCHDLKLDHNQRILERLNLNDLTHDEIIRIVRLSQPQVCFSYNDLKVCSYQDRCTKLHICAKYVQHNCFDVNCSLSHTLDQPHDQMILNVFDLTSADADILDKIILYPEGGNFDSNFDQLSARLRELNLDDLNIENEVIANPIRPQNFGVQNRMDYDIKTNYAPTWQFCLADDIWIDFDEYYSNEIEKSFCDADNSTLLITCTPLLLENFPNDHQILLNFENLDATLSRSKFDLKIRRLRPNPEDDIFYWYHSDDQDKWMPYPENIQTSINDAFKKDKKRCFIDYLGKKLRIKFSDLSQQDRNSGEITKVKRRPVYLQ